MQFAGNRVVMRIIVANVEHCQTVLYHVTSCLVLMRFPLRRVQHVLLLLCNVDEILYSRRTEPIISVGADPDVF